MSEARDPDWQDTLAAVERSVADCLAALDRYEARFAVVLGTGAEPASRPARSLPPADAEGWHTRIAAARAGAEEVDRLLAASEAGWAKWRESFTAWRTAIEQPPVQHPGGLSHDEGGGDPAGGGPVDPVRRAGEEAVR